MHMESRGNRGTTRPVPRTSQMRPRGCHKWRGSVGGTTGDSGGGYGDAEASTGDARVVPKVAVGPPGVERRFRPVVGPSMWVGRRLG